MTLDDLVLDGLLALPVLTAALGLLVRRREGAAVGVLVAGSLVTLGWSVWAVVAMTGSTNADGGQPWLDLDRVWIAALDVRWHLRLDGIGAPLVLLTTLVSACCLVSLVRHAPRGGSRVDLGALLLLIETGALGAFVAMDMVLFFVFFEVALLPMWFVISTWGDPHDERGRRRAATRFLVFTVLGSALMLVGFVLVRSVTGTFDVTAVVARSFDDGPWAGMLTGGHDPGPTILLASVLVGLGLAVKTPLWPLHVWLPDAHSSAPTVGSVVLAALLLKLGTYGFIRFWMPVVDPSDPVLLPLFGALGAVGTVYGALACLAQTELKRLIAYSSVGHMGFVVLAVTTFGSTGVQAAVFASVAHGLITGLLFFTAGAVKDRYGTGELADLKALYGSVPRLSALVAFAAMASLGLPGLAGFWGEMLTILGALDPGPALPRGTFAVLAVIAALGVLLTSAYFLSLLRRVLQGERVRTAAVDPLRDLPDVDRWEWAAWSPLAALTVALGVAPGFLLGMVRAADFFGGYL